MRREVSLVVAMFAAACQPSHFGRVAPSKNVWVAADAGARDARSKDASTGRDATAADSARQDAASSDGRRTDALASDATVDLPTRGQTGICSNDADCLTGFCVDGVCCNSACTGPCRTCVQTGAIGSCQQVPAGTRDPRGICASGSFCNVNGACVPTSCTIDQDCGDLELCIGGTCHPCDATCITDPDCDVGVVCVHRNSCTYCGLRTDAGADAH